jgi:hypothetical protein
MAEIAFSLVPYEPTTVPVTITGTVQRDGNTLLLRYELRGDLSQVIFASPASTPERRDYLWEQTCFECFFGPKGATKYWEINLSPAGHWAFYRFSDHRAEIMQPEPAYAQLPFTISHQNDALIIELSVSLEPILSVAEALEVGMTAVIKPQAGTESYWALAHGEPADFHNRDTFIITL